MTEVKRDVVFITACYTVLGVSNTAFMFALLHDAFGQALFHGIVAGFALGMAKWTWGTR
jgi:hypothetical protein